MVIVPDHEAVSLIDDLTGEGKRALLQQILQTRRGQAPTLYPLSYGQQALYFLYLNAPASPAYHMVFALRIRAAGNLAALRAACQDLVNRHPVLRSRFRVQGSEPVQEILPEREIAFEHLSAEGEPWDRLVRRAIEASQEPFDLGRGPVIRFTVFSRAYEEHLFLLTAHHIVFDARSLWLVLDELRALYAARLARTPARLPPAALTYADYVLWQRQALGGPYGERLWAYWRQQLQGELPPLDLPYDTAARPPLQTYRGAQHAFELDHELTLALQAVARDHEVTIFTLLLASFQVLLHRYSGQTEILVGSPTACRTRSEFESLVGYFVNPVVFRASFAEDLSFSSHLANTHAAVLGGLAHQEFPFPSLVQRLQPKRDPSRSPIFQVMFVSQQAPRSLDLPIFSKMEPIEIPQRLGQFDLVLESIQDGVHALDATRTISGRGEFQGTIRFNLKYNADLFNAATIARMAKHMQKLLESTVANPHDKISRLHLLRPDEIRCRIQQAMGIDAQPHPPGCVHECFEAAAQNSPDSIAVVCGSEHLTNAELNARANQLAHYLRDIGAGSESLIAICLPRGIAMVVAVVGILKSGAAYLPLDPGDPAARLTSIIRQSKPAVLLAMQEFLDRNVPELPRVVLLDGWRIIDDQPRANPGSATDPRALAYVIYTSGTTGAPQGVAVEHRSIANYIHAIAQRCEWRPGMSFAMLQALTWDGCLTMLFGSLCTGGTLHVISLETALDGRGLAAYFAMHEIDCLKIVPSHFAALQSSDSWRNILPRVSLIFGGESPRWDWVCELQVLNPECCILNHYGPTEATVGTLTYRFDAQEDERADAFLPLGHPLANVSAYVLDEHLQPTPTGVAGGIYIGGAGVAREYYRNPEATAVRFLPDPFSKDGARLFRTGDRGRYAADNSIEFLGRFDNQIKIRGFRVEPREAEVALGSHPGVRDCVVAVREEQRIGKRLVAYVVANPDASRPSASQLREFLAHRLPAYLCPSHFVFVDALSLKSNGKVDYDSLPEPVLPRRVASGILTPRSETEGLISRIWQECLGLDAVSPDDNFFDLGGHSLLLIQVHSRLEEALGARVPVLKLFEHSTVRSLAEHLHREPRSAEPVREGSDRAGMRRAARHKLERQSDVRRQHRAEPAH